MVLLRISFFHSAVVIFRIYPIYYHSVLQLLEAIPFVTVDLGQTLKVLDVFLLLEREDAVPRRRVSWGVKATYNSIVGGEQAAYRFVESIHVKESGEKKAETVDTPKNEYRKGVPTCNSVVEKLPAGATRLSKQVFKPCICDTISPH